MVEDKSRRDGDPLASIRREIARLARQKKCRINEWTPAVPTEWRPRTVRDLTGEFFSDAGAWFFVADLAEKGHPMREVTLRNPPGKRAFEMKVRLAPDRPEIYIKVRLGSARPDSGKPMIIGYSFHYSVYS